MTDSTILRISGLRLISVTGNVIVDHVDLQLQRGEVLGLIGESGAGKSTIGLSSMCYARAGLHIAAGEVVLDGVNIRALDAEGRRQVRGKRIAYIAQSAAAAFNPAHSLMDQVCEAPVLHWTCRTHKTLAAATRTRYRAGNCSVPWRPWPCLAVRTYWCWTNPPPRWM